MRIGQERRLRGDARAVASALAALAATVGPAGTRAQEAPATGMFYETELTLVFTAGNSTASTFGLGAGLRRVWESAELRLEGGGLRTESGVTRRTAVGTPGDFRVFEETDMEVTAENYFVRSRFDRTVSERFFVLAGVGWERNTFAGFDARYSFVGGAGNTWWDSDRTRFSTDYSLTYTIQNDVIDDGSGPEGFGGLRVSWDFRRQMTGTTAFTSVLAINENLDTIEDLRADFANALLVEISETLAFRTSLKLLFDNLPSRTTVPLEQPAGTPTGGSVRVPLDKLDRVFTVALVASF